MSARPVVTEPSAPPVVSTPTSIAPPTRSTPPTPSAPPTRSGSSVRRRSWATGVVALAAAGALVLLGVVGIGAFGQGTDATLDITTAENAANGTVGALRVDDAYVVSAGTSASVVRVALANDGRTPDRLLALTTGGPVGGSALTAPPAGRAARLVGPTALPAGSFVDLENGSPGIVLEGVHATPGTVLQLTFSFERAGSVTLDLPVVTTPVPTGGG